MITAGFTLLRQFTTSLWQSHGRQSIIIATVIAVLSGPALALMVYGGYCLLGSGCSASSGSMSEAGGGTIAVTSAVTEPETASVMESLTEPLKESRAISSNRETKGDRIIVSAAEAVERRFVFDTPELVAVPLPKPKPDELIALQAPAVDMQPALGRDKREECDWDKLETLPDFMRSCLAPPLQLTPPKQ